MTAIIPTPTVREVHLPAGAVRVLDWEPPEVSGFPVPLRYFDGSTRTVELANRDHDVEVTIEGTQWVDGRVEREIRVRGVDPDEPLSVEQIRHLIRTLVAAENEAVELAARDGAPRR